MVAGAGVDKSEIAAEGRCSIAYAAAGTEISRCVRFYSLSRFMRQCCKVFQVVRQQNRSKREFLNERMFLKPAACRCIDRHSASVLLPGKVVELLCSR